MRTSFALLLTLLLLLAQTSARVHAVEHASDGGHEDHAPVCTLCLAQAQLAWCTPVAQHPDAIHTVGSTPPVCPILPRIGAHRARAYFSRAPPA